MKKIVALTLIMVVLLFGCSWRSQEGENMSTINEQNDTGILEPMSAESLVDKVGKLHKNTTMTETVEIFGVRPRMIAETNVNMWEYASGGVTITLSGIGMFDETLSQVGISYNEETIVINY